jgi:hypothetical protein
VVSFISFFKVCKFESGSIFTQVIQQKRLRKSVSLSVTQSKSLHELSEFDGLDPVEHVNRAIDEYLVKKKRTAVTPDEKNITTQITERSPDLRIKGAIWIGGNVGKYAFSALLLKTPAKLAIEKGCISKLSIWDPVEKENTGSFIGSCIVNYDRGWDIKPSKIAEPYYKSVITLLTQIPSGQLVSQ